jgi:hypothetical protein
MGLDLSRVEAWTREMLEAEARRRRIRNPQFRTRGELIRLLLKHQYGDQLSAGRERIARGIRTFGQARELLGMAVGAALSALPETLSALGLGRPEQAGHRDESGNDEDAAPVDAAIVEAAPEVARDRGAARPRARARRPAEAGPVARAEEAARAVRKTPSAARAEEPEEGGHARSKLAQVGPVATTRTFVEEPIRTRTMARLLSAQGHRERALAIYEELLAQNSADATLQGEAEAVRRGETLEEPALPDPPYPPERWPTPQAGDRLECSGMPAEGLTLRWQVTAAGERRACAVLGSDGELTLRVVSIQPDPERIVRSEITEHGPVAAAGEWQAPGMPAGARCFAAVGMRSGSRFVAIVHAHPNAPSAATSADAQSAAAHA